MAVPSRSDMTILASDQGFISRVQASLIAGCVGVSGEAWTIPFHRERQTYAVAVMNDPGSYAPLFANMTATDTNVINDATENGTVVLTEGNVAAQAALVKDGDIDQAVRCNFNAFFRTPGV